MRWRKFNEKRDRGLHVRGQAFAPVIFFAPNGGGVCAGRYFSGGHKRYFVSLQGAMFTTDEVTHWMQMPDAPAEMIGWKEY